MHEFKANDILQFFILLEDKKVFCLNFWTLFEKKSFLFLNI